MSAFRSNEDLFRAVDELTTKLESGGHGDAAMEIKSGFRCLNGLTDGWALFLQSIEKVQDSHSKQLDRGDRQTLKIIGKAVHKIVYRR